MQPNCISPWIFGRGSKYLVSISNKKQKNEAPLDTPKEASKAQKDKRIGPDQETQIFQGGFFFFFSFS